MSTTRVFRVFVSSTFKDMAAERDALHDRVYPRLQALCQAHGAVFQPIDLRWGISDEAGRDQRTVEICLSEVQRCQQLTRRPNFILLLGDRYGWQSLPSTIPENEFTQIIAEIDTLKDRELLQQWYRLDENAVPPHLILQPRTSEFEKYERWNIVESQVHQLLEEATTQFAWEQRRKYVTSATEQEVHAGIFAAPRPAQSTYCFFRTIHGLPNDATARTFVDVADDGTRDASAYAKLQDLKARLVAALPENIDQFEAYWKHDGITTDHIEPLCAAVYERLSQAILDELDALEYQTDAVVREHDAHAAFARTRTQHFLGRSAPLAQINTYFEQPVGKPFAIYGVPGSGKTTLLAQVAKQIQEENPQAELIARFIGVTPASSDIRSLLENICQQLAQSFNSDITIPTDYHDLVPVFRRLLQSAQAHKPIFILLDALDQLLQKDDPATLDWLPFDLPEHVYMLCSTLPGTELEVFRHRLAADHVIEVETMTAEEGRDLLHLWLTEAGRTLQPRQEQAVVQSFATNGLPLYLRLAFEEARLWKSYTPDVPLTADIPGILRDNLFRRLEAKANHGPLFCSHALAYLAAARDGLAEDELRDLLRQDDEYWEWFCTETESHGQPVPAELPIILWSRLYFDLRPYLTERERDGVRLLDFYHGQLWQAAARQYLAADAKSKFHQRLARYFELQVLYFDPDEQRHVNQRKLRELPFQLYRARAIPELCALLTNSPDWMTAQFAATQGDEAYAEDLEGVLSEFNDPLNTDQIRQVFRLSAAWQLVRARANVYGPRDLQTLVWLGRAGEALHVARLRTGMAAEVRFKGFLSLYIALQARGHQDVLLLYELLDSANQIESDYSWTKSIITTSGLLAEAGEFDLAQEIIGDLRSVVDRVAAWIQVAVKLDHSANGRGSVAWNEIETIVNGLPNGTHRSECLALWVAALITTQKLDEAFHLIQMMTPTPALLHKRIDLINALRLHGDQRWTAELTEVWTATRALTDARSQTELLAEVAVSLVLAGDDRADLVFAEAQAALNQLVDQVKHRLAAQALAAACARVGRSDLALALMPAHDSEDWRSDTVSQPWLSILVQLGRSDEAETLALRIQARWNAEWALRKLASLLIEAQRYDNVEALVATMRSAHNQAEALSLLAHALAQRGDERASSIFQMANLIARSLPDEQEKEYTLELLVQQLAENGHLKAAEPLLQTFFKGKDGFAKCAVVKGLALAGNYDQAEVFAQSISEQELRVRALTQLAEALHSVDAARSAQLLVESEVLISQLGDPAKARCQYNLVEALARSREFTRAETLARSMPINELQPEALSVVALALANAGDLQAENLFSEIQRLIRRVSDAANRAHALQFLATMLAEAQRFVEAETTVRRIAEDHEQLESLAHIAAVFARTNPVEAQRLLAETVERTHQLLPEGLRMYVQAEVALPLAQTHHLVQALSILGPRPLDEFIRFCVRCGRSLDALQPNLGLRVVMDVMQIVGWERSDWRRIAQEI